MDNRNSIAARKYEVYKRAATKKSRYIIGLLIGLIFIVVGMIISNEIVIFGGILVAAISLLNLVACRYAEKQLSIIEQEGALPAPRSEAKPSPPVKTKVCIHCGKLIAASSRFCEECGKKQQNA